MKKFFKIIAIIAISITVLFFLFFAFILLKEECEKLKLKNERINKCKTLSNYIEYHDYHHVKGSNESLNFYAKNADFDLPTIQKIKKSYTHYGKTLFICDDNTIYESNLENELLYSNGKRYKELEINIGTEIKSFVFYDYYFQIIGQDGNVYQSEFEAGKLEFKKLDYYNPSYYNIFINDSSIEKVLHSKTLNEYNDNNPELQLILLRKDGNIYNTIYSINTETSNYIYTLKNEEVLFSAEKYGKILDAEYSDTIMKTSSTYHDLDELQVTKIISENGLYYLAQTSEQEYIDSPATYEIIPSEIYNKYKNDIIFIDKNFVVTNDYNVISTSTLCLPIDKETK